MPSPAEELEAIEALARKAMFEHHNIRPRGFDSQRDRARIRAQVDALLDEHAVLSLEVLVS